VWGRNVEVVRRRWPARKKDVISIVMRKEKHAVMPSAYSVTGRLRAAQR
jgi:hypothetical protein